MFRAIPHKIKIYEALGSIVDDRIEISDHSNIFGFKTYKAKVFSSSGNKFYIVNYEPEAKSIMSNDNGSFRKGYLGYPSIAMLMKTGNIPYNGLYALYLKNIHRKDINTMYNNDFDMVVNLINANIKNAGRDIDGFEKYIDSILLIFSSQKYSYLGKKIKPPSGY